MPTKTQLGMFAVVGAVAWDAVQYVKVKKKYEKLLKRNIEYQNTIALQRYTIQGLDSISKSYLHRRQLELDVQRIRVDAAKKYLESQE